MAKREAASWRRRRWTVFLKAYQDSKKFRDELQNCKEKHSKELDYIWEIKQVIIKYGVSYLCGMAVAKYLDNPDLDETAYLKRIMPPIFIGSSANNNIDIERVWSDEDRKLSIHDFMPPNDTKALPDDVYFTAQITILPYVTISEFHELIDEYWPDIEKILKTKTAHSHQVIGDELLGNVRRPKDKEERDREKLIMKLTRDGEKDLYIQTRLSKSGFGYVTLENIRQIRLRYKRKSKD